LGDGKQSHDTATKPTRPHDEEVGGGEEREENKSGGTCLSCMEGLAVRSIAFGIADGLRFGQWGGDNQEVVSYDLQARERTDKPWEGKACDIDGHNT